MGSSGTGTSTYKCHQANEKARMPKRKNRELQPRERKDELRIELAVELAKIKGDKGICDESEVKKMETFKLTVSSLISLSPLEMSKLALHVLYDRLSRICNVGDLHDALVEYAERCEEDEHDDNDDRSERLSVEDVSEFVEALEATSQSSTRLSLDLVKKMTEVVGNLEHVVSVGCTSPTIHMKVTPTDFLALAAPFLARPRVKTSMVLDFLCFRRFLPGVVAYGAEQADVDLMMRAMDRVDKWLETRPAIQKFLDPPCVVVEPVGAAATVAGLAASLAACPAVHGQAMLPDLISGGGVTWNNVITCGSRQAAMAVASTLRARHQGPNGMGGNVPGAGQCRVMYFSMTGANHVEY